MKTVLKGLRAHSEKTDPGFLMGWAALAVLLVIGDLIDIRDHGLFTRWGALYVGLGIALYLIGAKLADKVLEVKINTAFSKGYADGIESVFESINKWGRL